MNTCLINDAIKVTMINKKEKLDNMFSIITTPLQPGGRNYVAWLADVRPIRGNIIRNWSTFCWHMWKCKLSEKLICDLKEILYFRTIYSKLCSTSLQQHDASGQCRFWLPYWTKFRLTKFPSDKTFRRTKFLTPSRNFDSFVRFLPDICIEILDKIFDGQNVSSDKIFDTKLKFRHFVRRIFLR